MSGAEPCECSCGACQQGAHHACETECGDGTVDVVVQQALEYASQQILAASVRVLPSNVQVVVLLIHDATGQSDFRWKGVPAHVRATLQEAVKEMDRRIAAKAGGGEA